VELLCSGASKLGPAALRYCAVTLCGCGSRTADRIGEEEHNRPALLFVRRDADGHYIVVRGVGHAGRLVQTLDDDNEPVTQDAELLLESRAWTGLAFVPHRTDYWLAVLVSVTVGSALLLATRVAVRRALMIF
jgi:hypothetical protein